MEHYTALPFSLTNSLIWEHYKLNFPNTLSPLSGCEQNWPGGINIFHDHRASVYPVALSPDETQVASGSEDKTIHIWNAQTGQVIGGPFEGHASPVNSVVFLPDGTRVASGSSDKTICI
jgi:WD40 repeat protein